MYLGPDGGLQQIHDPLSASHRSTNRSIVVDQFELLLHVGDEPPEQGQLQNPSVVDKRDGILSAGKLTLQ